MTPSVPHIQIEGDSPTSSVQDGGRFGAQRFGLAPAGAMDRFSLAAANTLVGAAADAAALEIGPLPLRLAARGGAVRVALYGAERIVLVGETPTSLRRSLRLTDGETLHVKVARSNVFTYLAIEGGIVGTPVFGSLSVHMRAALGAPYPRPLRAFDRLSVGRAAMPVLEHRLALRRSEAGPIRVVLGPQDDYFDAATIARFLNTEWRVSPKSDRMGYRLDGPTLTHSRSANIVSDGIAFGAIQIPGSGQPLVLLADRGTTGGYPKIAVIIGADLGRFVQTPAGGRIRFAAVSIEAAQDAARDFAATLDRLPESLETAPADTLSTESLLAANLAGSAINAQDAES
jgi:5-oxoprolinase (ATP-hydrolysing) subunit C